MFHGSHAMCRMAISPGVPHDIPDLAACSLPTQLRRSGPDLPLEGVASKRRSLGSKKTCFSREIFSEFLGTTWSLAATLWCSEHILLASLRVTVVVEQPHCAPQWLAACLSKALGAGSCCSVQTYALSCMYL